MPLSPGGDRRQTMLANAGVGKSPGLGGGPKPPTAPTKPGAMKPKKPGSPIGKNHAVSAFGVDHGDEVSKAVPPAFKAFAAKSGARLKARSSAKMNELNQIKPGGKGKGFLKAQGQYNKGAARQQKYGS